MVRPAVLLILVLAAPAFGGEVSPVQKVIELLEENKGKIAKDLAAEGKEMEEYATFCDDELTAKGYAIKDATSAIAELEAAVTEGESEIADGETEVATVGNEMAAKEKELGEASAVRATAKAAFVKTEEELVGSIDSLERAVSEVHKDSSFLQVKGSKRPSAMAAVKKAMAAISRVIDASAVNVKRRKALEGLLQDAQASAEGDSDELRLRAKGVDAPKADAYESVTGGIVAKLEEMKEKAEDQLSEARTGEMKEQHTFDMMAQSLNDGIKVAQEKIAAAKSNIEENTEAAGKAKDELVETKKAKKADEAYVASLTAECEETKAAWEERQASAKEEMAVIDKAMDILASRVKALVQVGSAKATKAATRGDGFGESTREASIRTRVVAKLQGLSRQFRSYALMEMVSAAGADPFEKIKGLIEEMIAKLQAEANEEATQKAFCDEETSKSKASKEEKMLKSDKLTARLDKATSTKAELENTVKELEGEVAELDKADAEAAKIRQEESATNKQASKDFKDSAEAVTEAISVLKEYYEGASLVQKATAPTFGGAKGDAANTIISILEMSGEDFEKLYMETEQEEAEAAAAYKKLTEENKVSRAAKLAAVKGSESEIKSLEVAMKNGQEDLDTVTTELDAVLSYMDKLKPQCESKAMSYEEKKSRREAEIEGLKEALSILGAA